MTSFLIALFRSHTQSRACIYPFILFPSHEISLAADPIAVPPSTTTTLHTNSTLPLAFRFQPVLYSKSILFDSRIFSTSVDSHHITSHLTCSIHIPITDIMPSIRSLLAGLCLTSCALMSTTSAAALPPKEDCNRGTPQLPLTGGKSFLLHTSNQTLHTNTPSSQAQPNYQQQVLN